MKAERDKRAQILEAEGLQAGADPGGRRPQGSRLPRRRGARALCRGRGQGHAVVSEAIAKGDVQAHQLLRRPEIHRGAGQDRHRPQQKIVLMPMEASSLIGSLGGIGAIAREVFGDDGAARRRAPAARVRRSVAARTQS